MNGKWLFRVIGGLVALAFVGALVYGAYGLGVEQGLVRQAASTAGPVGGAVSPYVAWPLWFVGGPFWGFHFLGLLFGIFAVFFVVRLISFAVWGPRWGHWRHMRRGWDDETGVPAMFREWHDRAHGSMSPDQKT